MRTLCYPLYETFAQGGDRPIWPPNLQQPCTAPRLSKHKTGETPLNIPEYSGITQLHRCSSIDADMEALTAVGLASNIVQFIGFAREVVSTNRSISRNADGALVEHLEIDAVAQQLQTLSERLTVRPTEKKSKHSEQDGKPSAPPGPLSKEEQELEQLCGGCRAVSRLLIEKINSLKANTRIPGKAGKKWVNFRQALKSVLAADEIEDLGTRLDRYQTAINTTLLVNLR
jgi:hypothetical protein